MDVAAMMMADLGNERRDVVSIAESGDRPSRRSAREEAELKAEAEAHRAMALKGGQSGNKKGEHLAKWNTPENFGTDHTTGDLENRMDGQGHRRFLAQKIQQGNFQPGGAAGPGPRGPPLNYGPPPGLGRDHPGGHGPPPPPRNLNYTIAPPREPDRQRAPDPREQGRVRFVHGARVGGPPAPPALAPWAAFASNPQSTQTIAIPRTLPTPITTTPSMPRSAVPQTAAAPSAHRPSPQANAVQRPPPTPTAPAPAAPGSAPLQFDGEEIRAHPFRAPSVLSSTTGRSASPVLAPPTPSFGSVLVPAMASGGFNPLAYVRAQKNTSNKPAASAPTAVAAPSQRPMPSSTASPMHAPASQPFNAATAPSQRSTPLSTAPSMHAPASQPSEAPKAPMQQRSPLSTAPSMHAPASQPAKAPEAPTQQRTPSSTEPSMHAPASQQDKVSLPPTSNAQPPAPAPAEASTAAPAAVPSRNSSVPRPSALARPRATQAASNATQSGPRARAIPTAAPAATRTGLEQEIELRVASQLAYDAAADQASTADFLDRYPRHGALITDALRKIAHEVVRLAADPYSNEARKYVNLWAGHFQLIQLAVNARDGTLEDDSSDPMVQEILKAADEAMAEEREAAEAIPSADAASTSTSTPSSDIESASISRQASVASPASTLSSITDVLRGLITAVFYNPHGEIVGRQSRRIDAPIRADISIETVQDGYNPIEIVEKMDLLTKEMIERSNGTWVGAQEESEDEEL